MCALLHDIGDTLACYNHPDIAAAILKPFVSEENLWMVQQHGIFQGYYFFHHLGMDRDMRDQFAGHDTTSAPRSSARCTTARPSTRSRDAAARRVRADGAARVRAAPRRSMYKAATVLKV